MGKMLLIRLVLPVLLLSVHVGAISPSDGCVVLTGANGFLAGHIAEVLLEKGYTVHGTVRPATLQKKHKVQFLLDLAEKLPGTMTLFPAELVHGSFDQAAEGCSAILATAFPLPEGMTDSNSSDPAFLEYQVSAGVEGTDAVMDVAKRLHMKVVLTSSVVACSPTKAKRNLQPGQGVYDESDWGDVSSAAFMNYHYAKQRQEESAYAWNEKNGNSVELASILFPFGVGKPKHNETASSFQVFTGMLGALGPFYFPLEDMHVVDLRDVARAHVHVMEHAAGKGRFIVSPPRDQSHFPGSRLVTLFKEKYPEYPVATIPLPMSLLAAVSPDKGVSEFVGGTNTMIGFDGTKIARELGFEYKYADKME
eukprot:2785657-Rhodomonas_salina.1